MVAFIPWIPDKLVTTFEWRTDVLRAADGTEQRIALWNHPKVTFQLEYNMVGDELDGNTDLARKVMRSILTNSPDETYQIPLRYESSFLTQNASAGATQVYLNKNRVEDWVVTGNKVYIENNEDEEGYTATVTAQDTVGSDLRLTLNTAAPYALTTLTTRVSPVVDVQPLDNQALGRYRVENGTFVFSGVMQSLYMFLQGYGVSVQYNNEDYAVWLREALQNGTDLIGEGFEAGLAFVGDVKMEAYTLWPKAMIRRDLTFSLDGVDDWRYFKAILFSCLGQHTPFLRPTFRPDFTLSAQPSSPSTSLVISDSPDYQEWFANADTFKRLALFLSDSSVLTIRIVSITDNLDGTLTLTTSHSFSRGSATIDQISLLEATRLGSDAVVLTSEKGVRSSLALQTLTGNWIIAPILS